MTGQAGTPDGPECVCLNCERGVLSKVFLHEEQQGFVIFAMEGETDGLIVQRDPRDGKAKVMIGPVRIETPPTVTEDPDCYEMGSYGGTD
ncbi:MAG: hypothetical protein HOJ23_11655 [Gammaproteobacteria bacterium]|jgi:hypothetical protein|nr:hypothetical protein [Gammaproteobacteria bacterium]